MNNKVLLIIVVILLAVFFGKKYLGNSGDRNFKDVLVAVDTASVNKIVVKGKMNEFAPITLSRTGSDWEVSDGKIKDNASPTILSGILSTLVSMKPIRLLTKDKAKWDVNQVSDSLGTKVQAYANDKLLADFVVGKFNYQQATRSMTTSVRLAGSDEVFTVYGFLSSTFNRKTDDFRDKLFVRTKPDDLTKVSFSYPGDSSFVLEKSANGWQVGGVLADSVSVHKYLSGLTNLSLRAFENGFEPATHAHPYQITIDGNNMSTVNITGYTADEGMVLNSSMNDDAYFKQGTFKPFDKLFVSKEKLLTPSAKQK